MIYLNPYLERQGGEEFEIIQSDDNADDLVIRLRLIKRTEDEDADDDSEVIARDWVGVGGGGRREREVGERYRRCDAIVNRDKRDAVCVCVCVCGGGMRFKIRVSGLAVSCLVLASLSLHLYISRLTWLSFSPPPPLPLPLSLPVCVPLALTDLIIFFAGLRLCLFCRRHAQTEDHFLRQIALDMLHTLKLRGIPDVPRVLMEPDKDYKKQFSPDDWDPVTGRNRFDYYTSQVPYFLYAEGNNLLRVLSFMEVDQVLRACCVRVWWCRGGAAHQH